MLTKIYALISLLAAAIGIACFSLNLRQGLLLFAACFALLLLLFILYIVIASISVDNKKPLKKISPICRSCCDGIATFLNDFGLLKATLKGAELLPKDKHFLMVCNHRSAADPMVAAHLLKKFRLGFVSKPSNMALPVLGRMAYGAGFLAIDRENDRSALKTILTAAGYVKNGVCSMCIYPEGTRSRNGELLPFHAGSFKIAQKAAAPLVIACSTGTEKVAGNLKRLRASTVGLEILEVMDSERVCAMSTAELAQYSRELIAAHLEKTEAR